MLRIYALYENYIVYENDPNGREVHPRVLFTYSDAGGARAREERGKPIRKPLTFSICALHMGARAHASMAYGVILVSAEQGAWYRFRIGSIRNRKNGINDTYENCPTQIAAPNFYMGIHEQF